jgi:hypothetical protein
MWAALQNITAHKIHGAEAKPAFPVSVPGSALMEDAISLEGARRVARASQRFLKDLPIRLVEQCRLTSACS